MGLILGIAFWLIVDKIKTMKPCQRKLFANTVHKYMILADTKHYLAVKLMAVAYNHRSFTIRGTLQKNQLHITRHLHWDTSEINWSLVLLIIVSIEVTLPTQVTVPLMDKYTVRSIINNGGFVSSIMLLTGATW